MAEQNVDQKISRTTTIDDLFTCHPERAQLLAHELTKAGLHCLGCSAATWETIESGMANHGMDDAAIDSLLLKLNALLEQPIDASTITLTPRAAKQFLTILADDGKEGWGLRFDEKRAGCSGFEYILDFSQKATPEDTVFQSNGIAIHVRNEVVDRLLGCEIDYVDGLRAGFKIANPHAKKSCHCGSSHSY